MLKIEASDFQKCGFRMRGIAKIYDSGLRTKHRTNIANEPENASKIIPKLILEAFQKHTPKSKAKKTEQYRNKNTKMVSEGGRERGGKLTCSWLFRPWGPRQPQDPPQGVPKTPKPGFSMLFRRLIVDFLHMFGKCGPDVCSIFGYL